MLSILLVLLPVALLLFSGILADRLRLIPSGGAAALNQFVFNISMPCLVFSSTALCSPEDLAQGPYILGTLGISFVCCWLVQLLLSRGLRKFRAEAALMGFLAGFSNAAFLGLPILMEFMPGNHEVVLASTITIVMATALIVFCMFLLEWYSNGEKLSRGKLLRKVMLSLLRNPILIATLLGGAACVARLPIPEVLLKFLRMGAATAVPCALVAQGMVLSMQMTSEVGGESHPGRQIVVQLVKLVLMPLLTWLALDALDVSPAWLVAGVVLAAMPTGSISYVISETYGVGERDCSQIILLGTAVSVLTVPVILYALQRVVLAGI
ncbi:MAG TPA: AEC family transporter [Candidatus Mailhella excrementigallinarum]|nr:AEC family transporter [Candidatus Mailhella excrementigallinarum]